MRCLHYSGCLPDWATELPRNYAFLFPFETRYSFLQSTSFGYARLIAKHMTAHQANTRNSRRFDDLSHLARITRQKVRISRAQLLESCAKVMQLYGNTNGILEVEYFDEIGTGLGPTLEFYSQSSLQIARRDIKLWRDEDETKPGEYVFHPKGLFPAPISWEEGSIESSSVHHIPSWCLADDTGQDYIGSTPWGYSLVEHYSTRGLSISTSTRSLFS